MGWPAMNMSSPTLTNFAWNRPEGSRVTGFGTGPVLPLPTTLCAPAGTAKKNASATATRNETGPKSHRILHGESDNILSFASAAEQTPTIRRHRAQRLADLPVMTEGIDNAAHEPACTL